MPRRCEVVDSAWAWSALDPGAGARRLVLADHPPHLVQAGAAEGLLVERRGAGQQLVEQHAQRIDVAAGIDVQPAHLRLLGAHVQRRADELRQGRVDRLAR